MVPAFLAAMPWNPLRARPAAYSASPSPGDYRYLADPATGSYAIGIWWDGGVAYFTCAAQARKARNIAHEPEVVLHNGDGTDAIILKGRAERVTEPGELERIDQAYREKYVDPHSGASATIFVADDHVYRVRPRLVMAWSYADMTTRTDWRAE